MTPKPTTRDVQKSLYVNFRKRAEECVHAGENHEEVVSLFMTIKGGDEEIKTNANRILRILRIKNMAEYEERLVYRPEAEKVLKDCERLLEFVKRELP